MPSRDASPPAGSAGRADFFSLVCRIGAGDPVLGSLPAHAEAHQGGSDGFATDLLARQPFADADLGQQVERPQAGLEVELPGAAMEQRPQALARRRVEGGLPCVRRMGTGAERGKPTLVEGGNSVEDGLVAAAELLRDAGGPLAAGAGEQNLGSAEHKGLRRAQPVQQRLSLLGRQVADKDRRLHASQPTPMPRITPEIALGANRSTARESPNRLLTPNPWS